MEILAIVDAALILGVKILFIGLLSYTYIRTVEGIPANRLMEAFEEIQNDGSKISIGRLIGFTVSYTALFLAWGAAVSQAIGADGDFVMVLLGFAATLYMAGKARSAYSEKLKAGK